MSLMVMINVLLLLLIVAIFHDDYDEMHAYDHLFVLSETVGYFTHTHTHTHTDIYYIYIILTHCAFILTYVTSVHDPYWGTMATKSQIPSAKKEASAI